MNTIKVLLTTFLCLTFYTFNSRAQSIGINLTGEMPDNSALLDLNSSDKGFLIPRAEPEDVASPAFALMTIAPSDSCLWMFNGKTWISLGGVGIECSSNKGEPLPNYCGSPITDKRDNEVYNTVSIGDQCWMSDNLNYATATGSWCYSDDDSKCEIYGRLYDWNTATNNTSSDANPSGVQGVCPDGWHLPSDAEWKELEMFLGMTSEEADKVGFRGTDQGDALKSTNFGGNNSSGFSAVANGSRSGTNYFSEGTYSYLWSSTRGSTNTSAWYRYLYKEYPTVNRSAVQTSRGYAVRCIRD